MLRRELLLFCLLLAKRVQNKHQQQTCKTLRGRPSASASSSCLAPLPNWANRVRNTKKSKKYHAMASPEKKKKKNDQVAPFRLSFFPQSSEKPCSTAPLFPLFLQRPLPSFAPPPKTPGRMCLNGPAGADPKLPTGRRTPTLNPDQQTAHGERGRKGEDGDRTREIDDAGTPFSFSFPFLLFSSFVRDASPSTRLGQAFFFSDSCEAGSRLARPFCAPCTCS